MRPVSVQIAPRDDVRGAGSPSFRLAATSRIVRTGRIGNRPATRLGARSRSLALLRWPLPLAFLACLWQLGAWLKVAREHARRRWNGGSRLKPSSLAQ